MNSYRDANQRAWDDLVRSQSQFAKVATDEECAQPLLTLDSKGWLPGSVKGLDVLCLAAGGGWQSILYACAGARVTVVDLSAEMLALDESEARRRNLSVTLLQASMDDLSELRDSSFDIVHQPVSTCYVPRIRDVYAEVSRVLRDQGIYISQHKQPTSLQAAVEPSDRGYEVLEPYYRRGPLPPVAGSKHREAGALEFLHRLEELLGGLCRAGFVIEDVLEPLHADAAASRGSFEHRSRYVAPYLRIKARRIATQTEARGRIVVA